MPNDDAKLFVAGLPDSISEEILKQLFESTGGKVVDVRLPKEAETGRPRGFGFVTFSSPAEATSAREALDGTIQSGRSISVRPCLAEPPKRDGSVRPGIGGGGPPSRGAPQAPDRTLYVGNLPYDCTQQEIETLVAGVIGDKGTVVRVHLPVDPDGRKRGFGFVSLSSSEAATAAAAALNGNDMRGRRLVVNLAHPKGDRPAGGPPGGGGFRSGPPGGGDRFGPPAPAGGALPGRRTFDERRRKFEDGGGAPKKKRGERERGGGGRRDWDRGDDD